MVEAAAAVPVAAYVEEEGLANGEKAETPVVVVHARTAMIMFMFMFRVEVFMVIIL
jgi:hypothetical protein